MILSLLSGVFAYPIPAVAEVIQPLKDEGLNSFAGPLHVSPENPRYFTDNGGEIIYLTGSHTWANFQEASTSYPPSSFDYTAYLDFLQANNHNFIRLWVWEQSMGLVGAPDDYYFSPMPYVRTGPGNALDGQPKFDLTQLDQGYFDRLRARVIEAGNRGIYVSVMLFDGWSISFPKGTANATNPWLGHPFNSNNNVNGVNGDTNGNSSGDEVHTLQIPAVTDLQETYVAKVIDMVNDLDNVLYEISNESHSGSQDWQYHMINYIKTYEAGKPKQHPVGMTVEYPDGDNAELYASPADWISPNDVGGFKDNPPAADGSKVIVTDTDHLWGIGGDRKWLWKSFTRGLNPIFMDCYNAEYCIDLDPNDPEWVSLRTNMGYALTYANRIDLAAMTPRADLCSTGYCLAKPVASGAEYLVYLPNGGNVVVDLSAVSGSLSVEWFNPQSGIAQITGVVAGGNQRTLTAPFSGDAVLYIFDDGSPTLTPSVTPTPTLMPTNTQTATIAPTGTFTFTPTNTSTATRTSTITNTPVPTASNGDTLYVSSAGSGTVGSVSFADEDILSLNRTTGVWSLYFDGSDVGLSGTDVDAFSIRSDGSFLLSMDTALSIGNLGTVADADIVRFVPASLGVNTAGTFTWYFDGSDVGLATSGEDVDTIDFAPNGNLVVSTTNTFSVTGASGGDEDLIAFSATSLGSTTSGTWSMYFDGSDVGLADSANEDMGGLWIHNANGKLYLSTLGMFSVTGISGDGADIFICVPGSLGSNTSCTYDPSLYWDGSANGFAGQVVDGFDVMPSAITPTHTPSPLPTNTLTATPTGTPTITLTSTPTNTATATFTPSSTPSLTPTQTSIPYTATHTATNTPTPINYVYPIKRGANDRLLYDQTGRPFFWSGDSPVSLIVQLNNADVLTYLNDRQAKGVNVILVNLIDHTFGANAPANIFGDPPFTGNAFTTPNEAYFAHVDWVIDQAAVRNITVLLIPFDVDYQCVPTGCGSVNAASISDMTWWGTYLGNRYKAFPNIVWGVGANADSVNYIPRVNAFVDGLTNADVNHLVLGSSLDPESLGTDYWSGAPWMKANGVVTNDPALYRISKTAYDYIPTMPFFLARGVFENEFTQGVTDQLIRSEAYYSVLSGGIGYTYGNCPIWFFNAPAGAGYCDGTGTWQSNLNSSGAIHMQYAQQFFSHRRWYDLVPDWNHNVLVSGYGTWGDTNYVTAAQTSDQSMMIAYLPSVQTVTVDMSQFFSPVNAWWYDPTSGNYQLVSGSPLENTGGRLFTPPGLNAGGDGDWVLILETVLSSPPTATPTSTFTLTPTPTSTETPVPTVTFTATNEPASPTPTFTDTPVPTQTFTDTPVPPTATDTLTPTSTATHTSTSTYTNTPSPTASFTATNTPLPPTATATRTATRTPTPTASTIIIGETNILAMDDYGNANLLIAQQVTLSQAATIQSLSIYLPTAGGQLRLGIYSNNGNNPGTLLAQTASFTPVAGWATQNVQTPVLLQPGTYWLAFLPQSSSMHYRIETTGSARAASFTFGAMPGTYPSSPMTGGIHYSFYATLTR